MLMTTYNVISFLQIFNLENKKQKKNISVIMVPRECFLDIKRARNEYLLFSCFQYDPVLNHDWKTLWSIDLFIYLFDLPINKYLNED